MARNHYHFIARLNYIVNKSRIVTKAINAPNIQSKTKVDFGIHFSLFRIPLFRLDDLDKTKNIPANIPKNTVSAKIDTSPIAINANIPANMTQTIPIACMNVLGFSGFSLL